MVSLKEKINSYFNDPDFEKQKELFFKGLNKKNKNDFQIATAVLDSKLLETAKTWRGPNTEFFANRKPKLYKKICSRI